MSRIAQRQRQIWERGGSGIRRYSNRYSNSRRGSANTYDMYARHGFPARYGTTTRYGNTYYAAPGQVNARYQRWAYDNYRSGPHYVSPSRAYRWIGHRATGRRAPYRYRRN